MRFVCTSLVLALSLSSSMSLGSEPVTCELLKKESRFTVGVTAEGLLSMLAHDRVISAKQFDGTIIFDPNDHQKSRVQILIATKGLTPVDEDLNQADAEEITENMRSSIKADEYPTISFSSDSIKINQQKSVVVGRLRMTGRTRRISVPLKVTQENQRLTVTGSFRAKQSDFGITPYSAALGTIRVADELSFEFTAIAQMPIKTSTQTNTQARL